MYVATVLDSNQMDESTNDKYHGYLSVSLNL